MSEVRMDELINDISISFYKERTEDDKPDLDNIRRIVNDNLIHLNELDKSIMTNLLELDNKRLLSKLNILLEHHTRKISADTGLLSSLRKSRSR